MVPMLPIRIMGLPMGNAIGATSSGNYRNFNTSMIFVGIPSLTHAFVFALRVWMFRIKEIAL